VSNQITPISTSHRRGLRTTHPVIFIIILLAWIELPVVAWTPPDALTTRADDSASGAAQNADEKLSLEPGKPVERELSSGQSHLYKIAITSGQYLQVTVNQQGIDAMVALFTPDGKKIGEADNEKATVRSETISAIAEETGPYRIEVRSAAKTVGAGRYEIKIEALKMATAEDKHHVAAESIFREAKQLENGPAEDKRKSVEKYQTALQLFREASDQRRIAESFNSIGRIHISLGERQKANENFNQALMIFQEAGDQRGEAKALNNLAVLYTSMGKLQEAVEKFNESLSLKRKIGDTEGERATIINIGAVYKLLGETQKALEKYNEALPLSRVAGDRNEEAATLNNIAGVFWTFGDRQKALEKFNEALQIRRTLGDRESEAEILNNIGLVHESLGETQKALDKHKEALSVTQAVGNRFGVASSAIGIGRVYFTLGELQKAQEKFNEALAIFRVIGDRRMEANALNNLGNVHFDLGEMRRALEKYHDSLHIRRAVHDRRGEAQSLHNIGTCYNESGEWQKALENFNQALPIRRAIGDRQGEASTLHSVGTAYRLSGDLAKSLENFNESLLIRRSIRERDGEVETLLGIAQAMHKQGNLSQARQAIEQAIVIIENTRTQIDSQNLRASFLAKRHEYYQSYIDILMEQHRQNPSVGFDALAFGVSERARARSLLELLMESGADIRQGVDSFLLERERNLQQLLNAKAAAQVALLNRKHTPTQAEYLAKEIAAITTELEELRSQIRERSPRYATLTQPLPLSLAEIQRKVLDPDTLLLEYSLGDDASYLFVVSQTSITNYQLPKRAEVEAATRRVRELLTAPQPQPGDTEAKYQARIKEAKENYWPQAAELSRMLLGPAASQLGGKRLLIVADGALQYLPFGVLPIPETERRKDRGTRRQGDRGTRRQGKSPLPTPHSPLPTPLIAEHEIVHLPSASTLAVLRRELAGRKPAAKTVAVLADPVFSADDARVKSGNKTLAGIEAPADLMRAINDVRGDMRRLLLTRDEAEAILSVSPRTSAFGALDFRANRATATSDELSRYRIVHFATHGLLNSEHPELSGVVLSLVDERGQPQDGFLRLHEIFNLRLQADLVVLSACQTGLGKEVKGEGLVGLTRGFMYAGAARVVASLWQVNDVATAELMKRFYRRMLKDGMRPAAALRAAQIEMWKRPQWQSPFYWGGFVLQGEWK
jgi:CHAT domain-containing protein/Tfp pilus assembly protein PilF